MRCREIMKTDIESCWDMDSVADVAERMRVRGVGFVPVCDDGGEVVGTITDRDIAVRLVAQRLPHHTPVHRIMSTGPVTCSPEDTLAFAEDLMRRFHKSRIICIDDRMRPVGVISLSDVASQDFPWRAGRTLREVSWREAHPSYVNG
jgi:CBS domain-containing protein